MRFAVGQPGSAVRAIIDVQTQAAAEAELRHGEVLVATTLGADRPWTISADGASLVEGALPFPVLKLRKVSAIRAVFAARIVNGLAWDGEQISIDDGSRANLGGMALKAAQVIAGNGEWTEGYQRGWVANSGARVPLDTPEAGYALADAAAALYSNLVHHEQDLEDAANAATTLTALDAVDPTAGWPTS